MLQLAASLEQNSRHPLAHAVLQEAQRHQLTLFKAKTTRTYPGQGLSGELEGIKETVRVGKPEWLQEEGVQENRSDEEEHHHNESPKTVAMLLTEAASRSPRYKSDQKIFYLKMVGDYHRYLAEIQRGEARIPHAMRSQDAYEKAFNIARDPKAGVATTHPVRLGLALNYAVFHHEIREETKTALEIAQTALDEGLEDLDALTENARAYKDAALILKLIKDNISMWQSYTSSSRSSGGKDEENKNLPEGEVDAAREQFSKAHIEEQNQEEKEKQQDPVATSKENRE